MRELSYQTGMAQPTGKHPAMQGDDAGGLMVMRENLSNTGN
jgi:hypothetical protein